MKFATITVNRRYRVTLAYEELKVTNDNFTKGGERIEFYMDHRIIAVVYGRIVRNEKVSEHFEETIIEIAA